MPTGAMTIDDQTLIYLVPLVCCVCVFVPPLFTLAICGIFLKSEDSTKRWQMCLQVFLNCIFTLFLVVPAYVHNMILLLYFCFFKN